jgi:hypothetical protein
MNKKTLITLIIIANLYGQVSKANIVQISEERFDSISKNEITTLLNANVISIENNTVYLDLNKLNNLLKEDLNVKLLSHQAKVFSTGFVPYGYTPITPDPDTNSSSKLKEHDGSDLNLVNQLIARYVPYGNT